MLVSQSLPIGFSSEIFKEKAKRAEAYRLKTAAFRDWQHKLNRSDKLPRGKYFRNKRPGKPLLIMDECHLFFKTSLILSPDQPSDTSESKSPLLEHDDQGSCQ